MLFSSVQLCFIQRRLLYLATIPDNRSLIFCLQIPQYPNLSIVINFHFMSYVFLQNHLSYELTVKTNRIQQFHFQMHLPKYRSTAVRLMPSVLYEAIFVIDLHSSLWIYREKITISRTQKKVMNDFIRNSSSSESVPLSRGLWKVAD